MTGFFHGLNVHNNEKTLLVVRLPRLFLCRTSLDYIFFLLCGSHDCTQQEITRVKGNVRHRHRQFNLSELQNTTKTTEKYLSLAVYNITWSLAFVDNKLTMNCSIKQMFLKTCDNRFILTGFMPPESSTLHSKSLSKRWLSS